MASFLDDYKKIWGMYLFAIETFYPSTEETIFKPFTELVPLSWDDSQHPNYGLFLQQALADRILDWGAVGVQTSKRISQFYERLLNEIILKVELSTQGQLTQAEKDEIERLKGEVQRNRLEKERLFGLANQDWQQYQIQHVGDPFALNYYEFLEQNSNYQVGVGYQSQELHSSMAIGMIQSRIDPDINTIYSNKLVFISPDQRTRLPIRPELESAPRDTWPRHLNQFIDGNLADFRTSQTGLVTTIDLQESSNQSTTIQSSWGGSLGYSKGIFGAGLTGSGRQLESEVLTHATRIYIKCKTASFNIWRGDWYNSFVISKYGALLPNYFGVTGYFNVIPTSYVIAKEIEIELTTTDTVTTHFEQHINAGLEFNVGPFRFRRGTYSRDYVTSSFSRSGATIMIKSTGNEVYILGARCIVPHSQQAKDIASTLSLI